MTHERVPAGWRAVTYKDVLIEQDERAGDRLGLPVLSVTKSRGPMLASERFGKTLHSRDLSRYRVAHRGVIVADPMLLWDGSIGIQRVVDAGLVSPDYRVYAPSSDTDPAFMAYVVRSPIMLSHYQDGARGTNVRRNRIARADFQAIPLALPPLPEQKNIAAILSAVEDAIEGTQAVIDQLQVVKKAMMAELLTRGLPGRHTQFKRTDIGEMPERWAVRRLEELVVSGPTNGRSPPSRSSPPGVPTFSIAAVRDGLVNVFENLKYTDIDVAEAMRFAVCSGDILIVRGNANPGLVGKCGVVDSAPVGCIYPDILMRVRPCAQILTPLFVTIWNSDIVHRQVLDKATTTNGTFKINGEDVRSIQMPVPPLEEQLQISEVFASIDAAIRFNKRELEAREAMKSALMSVLLTGELRVTPYEAAP